MTVPDRPATDVPARVRVALPATDPVSGTAFPGVALLTIDRPDALNALDSGTMEELVAALSGLDADPDCRCIVLTGAGHRAFAAGADIREMVELGPDDIGPSSLFARWDEVAAVRKPIIAAVRGFALGGGCELALACDIIVAAEDAVFGQPEVRLGIIPGVGGTQRLTRAVGPVLTMDMVLTGRRLSAREAEASGLVSAVLPADQLLPGALSMAARIASQAPLAVLAAKQAVRAAQELPLSEGVRREREIFRGLFATEDQEEGMRAFLEKREPRWKGR